MKAAVLEDTRPGNVRDRTNGLVNGQSPTIVRVDTSEIWPRTDWPRDTFFAWFDKQLDSTGYRNEYELARAADVSHSSISSWRKGRTRPGTANLRKLAPKLKVSDNEILARAGDPNAALGGGHEATAEERRAIAMIQGSKLSPQAKDMLIRQYLDERRQAETKLKQTIGMLEDAQSQ